MYIKLKNNEVDKYPYSYNQLKSDNPQTSFPSSMSDDGLASWNVYPVKLIAKPEVDYTKNVNEDTPKFINNEWVQVWEVTPTSEEEIAERETKKASEVRSNRNQLLTECDWTQVLDAPVDQTAWAVYRQALRDITAQPGFPWEVEYPQAPTNN